MNEEVIGDYTTLMKDGVRFEPASGILDEAAGQVYIWDGVHRGEAAKRLKKRLAVNLQPGTREEAEWLALTANQKHGLRRSRADKQHAIRQALRHPRGVNLSNSEIARHCGVDHKTVGRIRTEMETSGEIPRITARTVTRNGVTYQQNMAKPNNFATKRAGQSYEGDCPHCTGAIYYAPDPGHLFCEQCGANWPNARALASENSLTNIDEIICTTLDANDPKWGKARHDGLTDPQLRDMIAQRWGRGSGQVTSIGVGYWVAGYPKPALWVGRGVLDENKRDEIPTLDGAELLTAVRAALRLPHGPETRYCRQCGAKEKQLAGAADAARPTPCPACGANKSGVWLKNPPTDPANQPSTAPANGTHPTQHSYILEEDQPQPCPECGEKRVRGVNGSQRWCIGCGANWPTAEAFLADVADAAAPNTIRRAALTRRFAALVHHLSPAQLSEIEAVIKQMEKQSSH